MKMQYKSLKNKPRTLRSLTGMTPAEFKTLLTSFGQAWAEEIKAMSERPNRKRAYGAGRTEHLEKLEDKLLFILFYYRQYPTQEVQGFLFGMSQSQANEWIHRLSRLLQTALGYELLLPERRPAKLEAVLSSCPSLEFIIDGTERPINRPQDKEKQKDYYSGKKKSHTVKNNVIIERGGQVLYLSRTYEGKRHDKKIADDEGHGFPPGSTLLQDTGYQGYQPEGVLVLQPKKKPRNGQLSETEKVINRAISSLRVDVEHKIGGVKRAQIVVQRFRNRVVGFVDEVMENACGLHNLRLVHRQ